MLLSVCGCNRVLARSRKRKHLALHCAALCAARLVAYRAKDSAPNLAEAESWDSANGVLALKRRWPLACWGAEACAARTERAAQFMGAGGV